MRCSNKKPLEHLDTRRGRPIIIDTRGTPRVDPYYRKPMTRYIIRLSTGEPYTRLYKGAIMTPEFAHTTGRRYCRWLIRAGWDPAPILECAAD